MTEQQRWDNGITAVENQYAQLPTAVKERISALAAAIRSCKEAMASLAADAGAGETCAGCGGECCKGGKNHVRAVDAFLHLNRGCAMITPSFDDPVCPYLGEHGCLMEAGLRPFNCIAFICEEVEGRLTEADRERYYAAERELRARYRELEELFERRFRSDLLSAGDGMEKR